MNAELLAKILLWQTHFFTGIPEEKRLNGFWKTCKKIHRKHYLEQAEQILNYKKGE